MVAPGVLMVESDTDCGLWEGQRDPMESSHLMDADPEQVGQSTLLGGPYPLCNLAQDFTKDGIGEVR